jgi:hypothetical protein
MLDESRHRASTPALKRASTVGEGTARGGGGALDLQASLSGFVLLNSGVGRFQEAARNADRSVAHQGCVFPRIDEIPRDVGLGVFGPELPMGEQGRDSFRVAFLWRNPSEAEARARRCGMTSLAFLAQFTHESYMAIQCSDGSWARGVDDEASWP